MLYYSDKPLAEPFSLAVCYHPNASNETFVGELTPPLWPWPNNGMSVLDNRNKKVAPNFNPFCLKRPKNDMAITPQCPNFAPKVVGATTVPALERWGVPMDAVTNAFKNSNAVPTRFFRRASESPVAAGISMIFVRPRLTLLQKAAPSRCQPSRHRIE
jgi:hypothetical protein